MLIELYSCRIILLYITIQLCYISIINEMLTIENVKLADVYHQFCFMFNVFFFSQLMCITIYLVVYVYNLLFFQLGNQTFEFKIDNTSFVSELHDHFCALCFSWLNLKIGPHDFVKVQLQSIILKIRIYFYLARIVYMFDKTFINSLYDLIRLS